MLAAFGGVGGLAMAFAGVDLLRLAALPEVAAAGITPPLPLTRTGIDFDLPYRREGEPLRAENELPAVN